MYQTSNKVVIIGGGATGTAVAARLRRLDEAAEIVLLERSKEISYAAGGIPYFLGGIIKDETRLQIRPAEELSDLLRIDIRTQAEVFSIKRDHKAVIVRDLRSGEVYEETYQKLVLATGSVANRAYFDGANAAHIFTVRNRDDGLAIKYYLDNNECKRALVVGAGLTGLETAENLHRLGLTVTLLEKSEQILGDWDPEMSVLLQRRLWDRKIRVINHDSVLAVKEQDITLQSGKNIKADIIVLAMGVTPNIILVKECGLNIGPVGGVSVNSGLLTSDEHIYALGDVIELHSHRFSTRSILQPVGSAYKQARIVADNLCGRHSNYDVSPINMILKVFDLSIAVTGATEKQLIKDNINYHKSYSESQSLARYYPKTRSMIIKLIFAPNTGTILGAQIVGGNGVDKRIDVIATAMHMELPVDRLKDLNLCFSPPFSGVRDPVNVAGMIASNMRNRDYRVLHWEDFEGINPETVTLVDVRSSVEFGLRTIDGAINIPIENLRDRYDEIPRDKLTVVFSNHGKKGYFAHNLLRQLGFSDIYNISGGLTIFHSATLTLSKAPQVSVENRKDMHVPSLNDEVLHDELLNDESFNDVTETVSEHSAIKSAIEAEQEVVVAVDMNLIKEVDEVIEVEEIVLEGVIESLVDDVPVMDSPIYAQQAETVDLMGFDLDLEPNMSQDDIPVLEVESESVPEQIEEVLLGDGTSYLPQARAGISYSDVSVIEVDAIGLNCPGPIMKLAKTMSQANAGDIVRITATDTKFGDDLKTWCEKKGHRLLEYKDNPTSILAVLLKC